MSSFDRRQFLTGSLSCGAALTLAGSTLDRASAQGLSSKLTAPPAAGAVAPPPGIKTFSKMPRTATEVAAAHLNSRDQAAEFLQAGELLEFKSFSLKLTKRDAAPVKGKLPNPSTRRFMLSVGIDLKKEDQARLPTLSKETILEYLAEHYVSVQARVQKEAKGSEYLHHRCIVCTGTFSPRKLTEDFHQAVANSVREIHSLGMYLPPKVDPTPENLRTAVLVHKHIGIDLVAKKTRPEFELIFFRGKQSALGKLDLHCFVTTDMRTKLHYVKPALKPPMRYADCSLKAQVYFSKYVDNGLVPSDSVVRNQTVNSQATFLLKDLDAMVKSELHLSDAFTNLNETLDAIIDGKLKPLDAKSAPAAGAAQAKKANSPSATSSQK